MAHCYNGRMKPRINCVLSVALLVLLTAGCAPTTPPPALPTPTAASVLTPFATSLPTATRTPPAPGKPSPLPSPTPTPLIHIIKRGETLGVIAFRYGVTVEAILAANPGIQVNAISIGAAVVIPPTAAGGMEQTSQPPTPAPEAVTLGDVTCYRSQENAAWCFLLAANPGDNGLENLAAVVRIADLSSGQIISGTATGVLNILPPGRRTALGIYFLAPVPVSFAASAELLTALPQPADDTRYLPASVEGLRIDIAPGGLSARLRGQVKIASDQPARVIWLGAMALNAEDQPVGLQRHEITAAGSGQSIDFDFSVYSSAGAIETVEVQVEARP